MTESQYNNPLVGDIPEGSDWDGEQHRSTEFTSPEAKAAHDAPGLIELARSTYGRQTVTVAESLDLRRRGNNMSGDDDVEAPLLRRAIAIELTKKPVFEVFVDGLALSEVNHKKLRAMLSPEAYVLSLEVAREMGVKNAPTRDQIAAELMTWSVDQLRNVCETAEKPTLLIVSDRSFDDGIDAMDANKHYQKQQDAYVYRDDKSPYVSAPKPKKGRVSIVEWCCTSEAA